MTPQEVRDYVRGVKQFFYRYAQYLHTQPNHSEADLLIISKMEKWGKNLQSYEKDIPPEVQEYTYLNLLETFTRKPFKAANTELNIMDEQSSSILNKTTKYLLDIQSLLLLSVNKEPFKQAYEECQKLIISYQSKIPINIWPQVMPQIQDEYNLLTKTPLTYLPSDPLSQNYPKNQLSPPSHTHSMLGTQRRMR